MVVELPEVNKILFEKDLDLVGRGLYWIKRQVHIPRSALPNSHECCEDQIKSCKSA